MTASSKSSPRHPVVTGERDELLDVAILVVPKLDGIWKRPPIAMQPWENESGTESSARHGIAMPVDKLAA